MPRKARSIVTGRVYHVCNRGVERRPVFVDEADMAYAEHLLVEMKKKYPVKLYNHCLMKNHWHLVLEQREDGALSKFMAGFTKAQAQIFRERHETVGNGHVYQGRFLSFPLYTDAQLLRVAKYVERNALTAGLVERAEQWRFGSLHHRVYGTALGESLLDDLALPGDWREYVNLPLDDAEAREIRKSISASRPIGKPRARPMPRSLSLFGGQVHSKGAGPF